MKHTITRRDVLASVPVVALGALLFVLPPAPDQPQNTSTASVVSAP
jgi:hypothetical protein